jgi:hypothetical protein
MFAGNFKVLFAGFSSFLASNLRLKSHKLVGAGNNDKKIAAAPWAIGSIN